MIASLRGLLAHAEATSVILDVGGVGYKVNVPASIHGFLPAIGESTFLHIHFHMRAEEISLYGFKQPDDQKVFELLLSVTGIGPKVALSILSALDAETLARTVAAEDHPRPCPHPRPRPQNRAAARAGTQRQARCSRL